jgi:hypothetical protein
MKNIKILAGVIVVLLTGSASCKKADTSASTDTGITTTITPPPTTIVTGTDPAIAATWIIGSQKHLLYHHLP